MAAVETDTIMVGCPSCDAPLELEERLIGHRVRCPLCRKSFIASSPEIAADEGADFPPWLIAFLCIAGFTIFCLFLAFLLGLGPSIAITLGIVATSLIIWQRQLTGRALLSFSRTVAGLACDVIDQFQRAATRPTLSPRPSDLDVPNETVRGAQMSIDNRTSFVVSSPLSAPPTVTTIWGFPKRMRGPSASEVQFYGAQRSLRVAGVTVDSPFVFFVDGTLDVPFDASLIEAGLPVASSAAGSVEELPYWPNYRGSSPKQRRLYLDWLTSGRCQADIPIGYVFIYFYGLERRALLDKTDTIPILREAMRLLQLYAPASGSFAGYASSFLWAAVMAAPNPSDINDDFIDDLRNATRRWTDESLAALLAWYCWREKPLAPRVAFLIAQQDPRAPRSIVVRRHPQQFEDLFVKRYSERFEQGMTLKTAKNDHVFQYRPASATLPALFDDSPYFTRRIANVRGISSQFKPLLELWTEAIEDLKAFDRAERKSGGQPMTAAMYEALPPELREDDHPDYDAWCRVIDRHTNKDGWTVVPISELAAIRGGFPRNRLTKSQSVELVRAAEAMELSLEPDPRISGQSYRSEDFVSVFPRESESDENLKSYHAASIFLRLGTMIAAADGEISSSEVDRITSQLREQFHLSTQDSTRLDHLAHLLRLRPPDDTRIAAKLAHLPLKDRGLVGEFLVGVAAADEVVTEDEVRTLKKMYRHLGLDPISLETLAVGRVRVSGQAPLVADQLILDPARIRQILTETAKVAELLSRVMLDEDSEDDAGTSASDSTRGPASRVVEIPPTSQLNGVKDRVEFPTCRVGEVVHGLREFAGLPDRFQPFAKSAIGKSAWRRSDMEQLARQHNLMLSGALEAINDWSLERCGDWLFQDDGDLLTVNQACVERL